MSELMGIIIPVLAVSGLAAIVCLVASCRAESRRRRDAYGTAMATALLVCSIACIIGAAS